MGRLSAHLTVVATTAATTGVEVGEAAHVDFVAREADRRCNNPSTGGRADPVDRWRVAHPSGTVDPSTWGKAVIILHTAAALACTSPDIGPSRDVVHLDDGVSMGSVAEVTATLAGPETRVYGLWAYAPGQPIVFDTGLVDADAWIAALEVRTAAGVPLATTVERWPEVDSIVLVHVDDPPLAERIHIGPDELGQPVTSVVFDDTLPVATEPPDWGRSQVRFRGFEPCEPDTIRMAVEPRLDDVWWEVLGDDGQASLGRLPIVEGYGLTPAETWWVTPVDAFGNRGETREVRYRGPSGGCSTVPSGGLFASILHRRR
jgi:hypothetical protein